MKEIYFQSEKQYCLIFKLFHIEIDDPLLFGGNSGKNRVEIDELEKGYRKKGQHGHSGIIQAQIFGIRGINTKGIKKWLLLP